MKSRVHQTIVAACLLLALLFVSTAPAGVTITPEAGINFGWDGNDGDFFDAPAPTNLASSVGTQIQSSFLAAGNHAEPGNVNDGLYGNSQSWIGADGDAMPYVGIDLNGTYDLSDIAWGRDNGNNAEGQFTDRSLGTYTVQITNQLDPATATDWTTIGTLDYVSSDDPVTGGGFTSYFRHQYDISRQNGSALLATGVRLLVPGSGFNSTSGTAIDELELFGQSPVATSGLLSWVRGDGEVLTSGSTVTQWSDHSGNTNHATPGTPPDLVSNSINGLPAVEFSSSIEHVNTPVADDLQDSDYEIFVVGRTSGPGIQFLTGGATGAGVEEYELHLNGSNGARFIPSNSNATTDGTHPDTFADLGVNGMFADGRAHIFNTRVEGNEGFLRVVGMENGDTVLNARSPFAADNRLTLGVRGNGLDGFIGDMGEVLVFNRALTATERREVERYLARKWDAPLNVASQTQGGIAFANQVHPAPAHEIDHLNNALYGNSESWLGNAAGGPGGYAGVKFDDHYDIDYLAFGRDATGAFPGRSLGTYTFQFTRDDFDPNSLASVDAATWTDFLEIIDPDALRTVYDFADIGGVTGVRVMLDNDQIAIDELEIYGLATIPEPTTMTLLGVGLLTLMRRRR